MSHQGAQIAGVVLQIANCGDACLAQGLFGDFANPVNVLTASGRKNETFSHSEMTVRPSGFLWSLAILVSSLLEAMLMVAVNLRSDRIRCFKCRSNGTALISDASLSSAWLMPPWVDLRMAPEEIARSSR